MTTDQQRASHVVDGDDGRARSLTLLSQLGQVSLDHASRRRDTPPTAYERAANATVLSKPGHEVLAVGDLVDLRGDITVGCEGPADVLHDVAGVAQGTLDTSFSRAGPFTETR